MSSISPCVTYREEGHIKRHLAPTLGIQARHADLVVMHCATDTEQCARQRVLVDSAQQQFAVGVDVLPAAQSLASNLTGRRGAQPHGW